MNCENITSRFIGCMECILTKQKEEEEEANRSQEYHKMNNNDDQCLF